jgi:hypothetical protein
MLFSLNKKAQAVVMDLLIGISLALIIIAAGIIILDNQINAVSEQQELLAQQKTAEKALNQLVTSAGIATNGDTNWEDTTNIADVKFIGLALSDRIILPAKINKFIEYSNSNYEETKGKLLIGQDFYFRLIDPGIVAGTSCDPNCATLKLCGPDSESNCAAGKTKDTLEGEGKKIDTILKSRRVVAFKGVDTIEAIAEITIFKTR